MPKNIILCGFMGTGKTTIGQSIARRLGWRFIDTDKLIEEREGRSINTIFAQDGEAAFRQLEANLCSEAIAWQKTVIATGGGIVLNPTNCENLQRAGLVICLEAPAKEIANRLAHATDRPLLAGDNPLARIETLLEARAAAYAALPNHINTAGTTIMAVTDKIVEMWKASNR